MDWQPARSEAPLLLYEIGYPRLEWSHAPATLASLSQLWRGELHAVLRRGAAAGAPGDGFHLMTESIFSATRLLNDGWCVTSDGDGVSVRPRGVRSAASGRAS